MNKQDILLQAFAMGDKQKFYNNYNKEKYFETAYGKIPLLCMLVDYSDKGLVLSKEEKRKKNLAQTEILKDLLTMKCEDGYFLDVNESDDSNCNVGEFGYKALDLALIYRRGDIAAVLIEREDIDLRKTVKKRFNRGFVEECSLSYAIRFCTPMIMPIVKKGNFTSDEVIYEKGLDSASLRSFILGESRGNMRKELLQILNEIEEEHEIF